MKKYLLGAAAALAIAAPGIASADTAQVGVHYGNVNPDSGNDFNVYGLSAAFTHDFSNGWALQADGSSDRLDADGFPAVGASYGALNLGMRTDTHSIYGYVGHQGTEGDAITVGVGGQLYFQNATVNASINYADFDQGDGVTDFNVNGTWFFTDNLGLTGNVGHIDGNGDADLYGVGGTYRFAGSPVALDLGWQHTDGDHNANSDAWRVGLTFNFGTDSARDQSQKGSSWDGASRLYNDILDIL